MKQTLVTIRLKVNNMQINISHSLKLSLSLLFSLLVIGCDKPPEENSQQGKIQHLSQSVSVVDFTGTTITLPRPAQRIVALAPHIVENVFSAGAGDRLVGVVDFSYFPEEAKKIPIIGGYKALNLERIIELKPDLIIAWESGNSHNSYSQLQELGFTVYVDQPHELKDVVKSIKDVGILSGTQSHADKISNDYLSALAEIRQANLNKPKVTSFYQVWNQPLRTISSKSIITDAMAICGGVNIYHDEIPVAPVINIESLIERDPVAIFASGMSSARPEWLDDWKKWPSLQAVQKNNLFFVDPDHIQRHTVRLLLAINTICEQLDTARNRQILQKKHNIQNLKVK